MHGWVFDERCGPVECGDLSVPVRVRIRERPAAALGNESTMVQASGMGDSLVVNYNCSYPVFGYAILTFLITRSLFTIPVPSLQKVCFTVHNQPARDCRCHLYMSDLAESEKDWSVSGSLVKTYSTTLWLRC